MFATRSPLSPLAVTFLGCGLICFASRTSISSWVDWLQSHTPFLNNKHRCHQVATAVARYKSPVRRLKANLMATDFATGSRNAASENLICIAGELP